MRLHACWEPRFQYPLTTHFYEFHVTSAGLDWIFQSILVYIDMITAHGCCFTTFLRCSVLLRSGDCRGQLWSTVKFLSCSRNQFEMLRALRHGTLSCWKHLSKDGIKRWVGTKRPKVCQENLLHTIMPPPTACTVDTRQDGSLLLCCLHQILTHLIVAAGIKTHQATERFSSLSTKF